jgi:hypothetical protein
MSQIDELITQSSQPITSLQEFLALGRDCLSSLLEGIDYMPVTSVRYQHYVLPLLSERNTYLRPINQRLFIPDVQQLGSYQRHFQNLVAKLSEARGDLTLLSQELRQFAGEELVSKTSYTTLQAIGCVLDRSASIQGARKNFGQRFEDFVRVILTELGIANDSFMFRTRIPIINVPYRVPLDVIVNTGGRVYSNSSNVDQRDTIFSVKTSSKDRMKLIFVDRFVLKNVLNLERINYVALYHNDIQRSGRSKISSTFVPDSYLVLCHVFGDLPLYYLDPPLIAANSTFRGKIKTFDTFILHDVWKL